MWITTVRLLRDSTSKRYSHYAYYSGGGKHGTDYDGIGFVPRVEDRLLCCLSRLALV
jgi:hypothetical protein